MEKQISKIQSWLLASRPKTLLAAFVPVSVGSALAIHNAKFSYLFFVVALLCSVLIQVGTNFTNDLFDYLKGADNEKRKGPLRVLASGLISVKEMKTGIVLVFATAFLLGLYLVFSVDIYVLYIGIFCIISGILYTAGPYPLAYHGLGDLFVFIFFGVVGTMGTYYLHTQEITLTSFLVSIPVGALITNILVVNNFRDVDEDRAANKFTLAVILGRTFSKYQLIISIMISYLIPLILFLQVKSDVFSGWIFLPLLSLPIAFTTIKMLYTLKGEALNKTLELTAKLSAIYGLLFSIGLAF
ncbi:MAG: 1,4-dihydroxy-2-naphthoate polyprenyltransferase [Bacteroidota bacterium]|nr:1,4-dihydroxy-2-naphthoate polyprenyltransferase [Bacteroidota bacterium]